MAAMDRATRHARENSAPPLHEAPRPQPTAAERAGQVAVSFERSVDSIEAALEAVDVAHAANDPERWSEARSTGLVEVARENEIHALPVARLTPEDEWYEIPLEWKNPSW